MQDSKAIIPILAWAVCLGNNSDRELEAESTRTHNVGFLNWAVSLSSCKALHCQQNFYTSYTLEWILATILFLFGSYSHVQLF